jgi:hypothetical protein
MSIHHRDMPTAAEVFSDIRPLNADVVNVLEVFLVP